MIEVEQAAILIALRKEMAEMKRKHEQNEEELKNLWKENAEMKRHIEGSLSAGPTNMVGGSSATVVDPKATEESKEKAQTEMGDESHPNKSLNTTVTMGTSRRHSFTDAIMSTPLPEKWKGFNKDWYDGTTDPDEHMDAYTTHMNLYTVDDAVLCRVFPTSLKGGALSWFTKLPPNFVNCFETLVAKFDTQFATSRPHHITSIAMVGIRQEKGESLRKLIDWFDKVTMSIWNLSPDVVMHHMLTTLRSGSFADNLCIQPATSIDEVRCRAAKFMQLEELREFKN